MKKCCRCGVEKTLEEFNRMSKAKDGRQAHCRPCGSSYYQSNAERHKANVLARAKRARERGYAVVDEYLSTHPCVDCGESDPVVLEFDHTDRNTKTAAVAQLLQGSVTKLSKRSKSAKFGAVTVTVAALPSKWDGAVSPCSSADRAGRFYRSGRWFEFSRGHGKGANG